MDWKDALSSLSLPDAPAPEEEAHAVSAAAQSGSGEGPRQKAPLHVVMEKKGRGGKTATIVEGFELPDAEVAAIAAQMKKRLGCGGSARGGEILIQGDRRADVKAFLTSKGFKTKG